MTGRVDVSDRERAVVVAAGTRTVQLLQVSAA
jgi:hypothetical protein